MMQRLEQMVREMSQLDDVTAEPEPPFTSDIMVAKYPPKFHLPQMEPYDGQMDPTEHLELYRTLIEGGSAAGESGKSRKNLALQARHELDGPEINLTSQSQGSMVRDILIIFSKDDARGVHHLHCNVLVATLPVVNKRLHRILIDNGSSADILFLSTFARMGLERSQLKPYTTPLHGFARGSVVLEGVIELTVSFEKSPTKVATMVNFNVVYQRSSYNTILERPTLYALKVTTSIYHYTLKFPTEARVGVVRGEQKEARECYEITFRMGKETLQITSLDPRTVKDDQRASLVDDLEDFLLGEDLSIDPRVIVHRLSTNLKMKPVRQKRRSLNAERSLAVKEEVDKLLKVGFVKEARYPDWLANVVMVKKANGKWRMCVDFIDLNKACPKDSFPLPRIDQLMDATAGHGLLSFMDAYSGYNQKRMHKPDQENTSFITYRGLYCYKVYVDDMLTKSLKPEDHVKDLRETFDILRKYKMRLNPAKCAFGVS
ncbi:uncharacterized protein LOC127898886 [Citrus sinensis]|uniref:uncharacterized protein LOC112096990 n=1 Tax=Citrus clementina TaxID=85681 RepID=UPI000763621D|nr:uncharacterized protein LOC112096990 [Citrus x clementina]XP_052287349.1 uncharacterized protein LOC127898886 [Citrus sinensis]